MTKTPWLDWAQRLQAIAQNGLAFSKGEYDLLRYEDVRQIAAEILSNYTEMECTTFHRLFEGEAGYATPKVDVRAAVFQDDCILLVKERSDGLWTLPGGWAEVGMSAGETAVKEAREESGYEVRAQRLLALYDKNKHEHPPFIHHTYKVFVECALLGGTPSHSLETEGVEFFRADALPPLSTPRTTHRQIQRLFELHRHPECPPDFD